MATKDGADMPGIVQPPQVVRDAVNEFGDLFANEPERRHFAEYLTGLMIAERKTVLGMNREFADTTDQSCLNKFVTAVEWSETQLNERRLAWLQEDSSTRYSDRGVIALDDVLIDHDGKQELGMGDCQLRDGRGQTRHMYLVMLAYSLLMHQLQQNRAKEWALCKLTTIGEACRAMLRETLRTTLAWAIEQVADYSRSSDHVVTRLGLT
jgi:SRSO17 transposase